jgi:hypothetical protein
LGRYDLISSFRHGFMADFTIENYGSDFVKEFIDAFLSGYLNVFIWVRSANIRVGVVGASES